MDTLSSALANQSLLFLFNAAWLAEKQQMPILSSLVLPDWGSTTNYRTPGEHTNLYTTDAIINILEAYILLLI